MIAGVTILFIINFCIPVHSTFTSVHCKKIFMCVNMSAMASKKSVVRVPKGTSSYQAAWITDAPVVPSDEEESEDESEHDDDQLNQLMVCHLHQLLC